MSGTLSSFLRLQRFKAIRPYLRGSVLDLGCGYAEIIPHLAPGQPYLGVDRHAGILDWLHANRPGHTFLRRDFDTAPLDLPGRYATILMLAVIEHLKEPDLLLRQLPALLEPDGLVVLTTPTPLGDRIHRLGARLGLFSTHAVNEHETIFDQASLAAIVNLCGLRPVAYRKFLFGGNQVLACQAWEAE
jgi:SAM-dependent methyltransferase